MLSLSYDMFSTNTKPLEVADCSIYEAIVKKKPTKEFMIIINVIKKILNRKDWVDPAANIMTDLGASKKQFDEIMNKFAATFSISENDKKVLVTKKTPETIEAFVLSKKAK